MDNQDELQELDLEAIMREFHDPSKDLPPEEPEAAESTEAAEEAPAEALADAGAEDVDADLFRVLTDTYTRVSKKMDELQTLIEDYFADQTPTKTQVNDFVWFQKDFIFEQLEISSNKS